MAEFCAWPKTQRLFRDIVVSEKLDGTNAGIHVEPLGSESDLLTMAGDLISDRSGDDICVANGFVVRVTAQSRNRLISPEADNFGFAAWVRRNQQDLARVLGPGLHMGEWWGSGINRGYGLPPGERRFSLFNSDKYRMVNCNVGGVWVNTVPVIYQGTFSEREIKSALANLAQLGSIAAPGFDNPEGIVIWHSQTRSNFKVTLDNNDTGKWQQDTL